MRPMIPLAFLALSGLVAPAEAATSGPATTKLITGPGHGVVRSIDQKEMVVLMTDGSLMTIELVPGWTVTLVRTATLADIASGAEVEIGEATLADGSSAPVGVHIFGSGMPARPHQQTRDPAGKFVVTMGRAATPVSKAAGLDLDLSYSGASRHLALAQGVPVLTFDAAPTNQVLPGTPISLFIGQGPDGTRWASGVAIGDKGAPPPD